MYCVDCGGFGTHGMAARQVARAALDIETGGHRGGRWRSDPRVEACRRALCGRGEEAPGGRKDLMLYYAATIALSAFLLFLVQPMIAKMILPWFGGSAAVWTTALMFFQITLLAGYVYSH